MSQNTWKIIGGVLGIVVIVLIVNVAMRGRLLSGKEYPGLINVAPEEEWPITEGARAQWDLQLKTALSVLERQPDDLGNIQGVATLYYQLGEWGKSRRWFERYFELNAINPGAWAQYADLSRLMGDYDTAERAFIKSIDLQHNALTVDKLEQLWRQHFPEKREEIRLLYERAVQIDGQTAANMVRLAIWYEEEGQLERAMEHLEIALSNAPEIEGITSRIEELQAKIDAQ